MKRTKILYMKEKLFLYVLSKRGMEMELFRDQLLVKQPQQTAGIQQLCSGL